MASGLVFGTGVILRRLPKEVPTELRRGHPAGLRDGSEGFIGRVLREYVSFSERLRKALSGWHVPKGFSKEFPRGCFRLAFEGTSRRVSERVFEGVSEWVLRASFRRGFQKGFLGGRPMVVRLEINGLDLNGEFGPGEQIGRS